LQTHQSITSQHLVDVAMGREPAELVIRGGQWVCVQSGEIVPATDIAISQQRIAYVGSDASHTIGKDTRIIEADNRYLVPGLLDGHMHVESGMLNVTEFVRAVLPHGTTGMFIDPHEIANVFGLQGVKLMVDESANQPIHVWVQVPSCVPSAPGFETPGATFGPNEIAEAMKWPGVIGLGEVMNFRGVYNSEEKIHTELAITREAGKVVGGHYASIDLGLPFHGYVAGGADDDHEGTRKVDAIARVRQGMKAMLRFGSAWHDVAEGVRAITEDRLDPHYFILCTDDSHCETLVNDGHLNRAVRQAIAHGIAPLTAILMATLNTAEHFGVSKDVGMIAPGRFADILLVRDLAEFKPDLVIAKGIPVAEHGKTILDIPKITYPDWAINSVHLAKDLMPADFRLMIDKILASKESSDCIIANVIGVIENQAPTRRLRLEMPALSGEVKADVQRDIAKVAMIDRHHASGRIQLGLVSGFGFNLPCAIGSTVAHDCHQMILVGTDDGDLAIAANELARIGGGQIVVSQGKVIGQLALPVAGLMSNERADLIARQTVSILDGFRQCGCQLNNPNMQLSLLGLVVIPDLRISDLGLVDVNQMNFIRLFEAIS
jgi:adenine deaminase